MSKDANADWALDRLVAWLVAQGIQTRIVDRPDERTSSSRAPDGVIEVDGATVAVEVTRVIDNGRDQMEAARLIARVRDRLARAAADLGLGRVVVGYSFGPMPAKAERRPATERFARTIEGALGQLRPGMRMRVEVEDLPAWVRDLELRHLPDVGPGISWVGSVQGTGGAIGPMAEGHVTRIIETKGDQADGYERAWVVLHGASIVDAEDLSAAFRARASQLRENWERVLLITGGDIEVVYDRTS
ncbi:MAG: hypothetical protein U0869_07720 [Chloroflexota bacterium]